MHNILNVTYLVCQEEIPHILTFTYLVCVEECLIFYRYLFSMQRRMPHILTLLMRYDKRMPHILTSHVLCADMNSSYF